MQKENVKRDNRILIDFWDQAFTLSEEQKAQLRNQQEDWKELAPSEKLFQAAFSLGERKKVLDYGCGSAWAAIIAAKGGCPAVTAVDAAPAAVCAAKLSAARHGVSDQISFACADADWLQSVPSGTYDGIFCSNVLDVIPPETTDAILRETARVLKRGGSMIVGLNYYLSPEAAAARGMELTDGNRLYMEGVLRLVSRTDAEWARVFSSWYSIDGLEHFAWSGEAKETRRLFRLRKWEDD